MKMRLFRSRTLGRRNGFIFHQVPMLSLRDRPAFRCEGREKLSGIAIKGLVDEGVRSLPRLLENEGNSKGSGSRLAPRFTGLGRDGEWRLLDLITMM